MALNKLLISMTRNVGAEAFRRRRRTAIGRPDSRPLLKDIRCKTLVLCGREDKVTPPDYSQEKASGIAESELVILEQCGHMAPLEQPDLVKAALSHWLGSVSTFQVVLGTKGGPLVRKGTRNKIKTEVVATDKLMAPLAQGAEIGAAKISYPRKPVAGIPVVALRKSRDPGSCMPDR
ncbi:alpha/beta fold hydrolase [Noviherbaspirillum pedocola]|uniref:Alpha/beta fold hydrolase n=1 Tax=Noviherbaspirillum pedocola TaxID=2801341 RepID=A0A934SYC2_9BURK|nr:alpha/beta fold hydrolase [Noviherbaspirillum pedocola]MBK4737286.1 alpha/beta fold hydrolase [Noviherbaspirillum pedocola]